MRLWIVVAVVMGAGACGAEWSPGTISDDKEKEEAEPTTENYRGEATDCSTQSGHSDDTTLVRLTITRTQGEEPTAWMGFAADTWANTWMAIDADEIEEDDDDLRLSGHAYGYGLDDDFALDLNREGADFTGTLAFEYDGGFMHCADVALSPED